MRYSRALRTATSAFSLIELLVVLTIMGVLAGVGMTTVVGYRERARNAGAQADSQFLFRLTGTMWAKERARDGFALLDDAPYMYNTLGFVSRQVQRRFITVVLSNVTQTTYQAQLYHPLGSVMLTLTGAPTGPRLTDDFDANGIPDSPPAMGSRSNRHLHPNDGTLATCADGQGAPPCYDEMAH